MKKFISTKKKEIIYIHISKFKIKEKIVYSNKNTSTISLQMRKNSENQSNI